MDSVHKGVSWYYAKEMWQAKFTRKGNQKWLGLFKDELDAKKAFDNETEKYNKDPEKWLSQYGNK